MHTVIRTVRSTFKNASSIIVADSRNPLLRRALICLYALLHLVLGFLTLWIAYFQTKTGVNSIASAKIYPYADAGWKVYVQELISSSIRQQHFAWTTVIEASFIIVCVVWGNLGWDRLKDLKKRGPDRLFLQYTYGSTAPVLLGIPLAMMLIEDILHFAKGTFLPAYAEFISPFAWFLAAALTATALLHRTYILRSRLFDGHAREHPACKEPSDDDHISLNNSRDWLDIMARAVSAEWVLNRRPNGGTAVLLRAVWVTFVLSAIVLPLKAWLAEDTMLQFSLHQLKVELGGMLTWIGAIFAASYAAFYARFAAQWGYLAGVYHQICSARVTLVASSPAAQASYDAANDVCDRNLQLVRWQLAYIRDSIDLHLLKKDSVKATVTAWLRRPILMETHLADTDSDVERNRKVLEILEIEETIGITAALPQSDRDGVHF